MGVITVCVCMVSSEWATIGVLQYTGLDTEGCSMVGAYGHTEHVSVATQ